jgi:hypothetical protein
MDINALRNWLERPEVHRKILAGYSGPYSLGIGKDPGSPAPALILQVEGTDQGHFPAKVRVDGEEVPLIVKRSFKAPVPLGAWVR